MPEPDNRIVLLDLNYTLVSNSAKLGYPHHDRLFMEEYRVDLLNAIRDRYIILITVRPIAHREATLERIGRKLNWLPNEAWFNENNLKAPACKRHLMQKYVIPKHGADPAKYFAIESNVDTRAMYAELGVEALHYNEFMGIGPAPSARPTSSRRSDSGELF